MTVIDEVAAECQRHVEEGFTPEHDDQHIHGELAQAAGCYCRFGHLNDETREKLDGLSPHDWPWEERWWKPKNRRRDMIRAASLIVAEIQRLDRAAKE